jgi:hypothetical protein
MPPAIQRTSNHNKKPGELYHGEAVLANPNDVARINYRDGSIRDMLASLGTAETDIALHIADLERRAEAKRAADALLWKAQDDRFAAAEAAETRKRDEELMAELVAKQAKDQKLRDEWSGTKVPEMPELIMTPMDGAPMIAVPPSVQTAALKNNYFSLAHFLPRYMSEYLTSSLNTSASETTYMTAEVGTNGEFKLKPGAKTRTVPADRELTLNDLCLAGTWFVKALRQWGRAHDFCDMWDAFFIHMSKHVTRAMPDGDSVVRVAIDLHRREWHAKASLGLVHAPSVLAGDLIIRATSLLTMTRSQQMAEMLDSVRTVFSG